MSSPPASTEKEATALLAELESVAKSTPPTAADPIASHGRVGGTNVLNEQRQSKFLLTPGLPEHRRRSSASSQRSGAGVAESPDALARARHATAFSTYEAGALSEAQVLTQRQMATPLGVRLTPMGGATTLTPIGSSPKAKTAPRLPTSPPTSVTGLGALKRPSLTALPPLKSSGPAPPPPTEEQTPPAFRRQRPSLTEQAPPAEELVAAPVTTLSPYREANFLPVMCARYLRPAGIVPTARWGHTLTSVSPDCLLLFGGVDDSGETDTLMELNPTTIAWEPAYAASAAPTPRHGHAACAYDGRYLVVSGGISLDGTKIFDDVHLFDTLTRTWSCVWDGAASSSPSNANEAGPRFGHSVVLREDRLYVYGGKALSKKKVGEDDHGGVSTILASGTDVFVFSLSARRWKRRLRGGKATAATEEAPSSTPSAGGADVPEKRAYHAACVKGPYMYIHGGATTSAVFADAWVMDLGKGQWHCLHRGQTADAMRREKHALFACGEALLAVGGCSGSELAQRLVQNFDTFAVVLPLYTPTAASSEVTGAVACWVPVAMGNETIVAPNRKGFAAAFTGGFVYVFGGVREGERATNTLVRFLATDGYVLSLGGSEAVSVIKDGEEAESAARPDADAQALRVTMQRLREGGSRGVPFDLFIYAGVFGTEIRREGHGGGAAGTPMRRGSLSGGEPRGADAVSAGFAPLVGFHRALLQQRAPQLYKALDACRSEPAPDYSVPAAMARAGGQTTATSSAAPGAAVEDELDSFLRQAQAESMQEAPPTSSSVSMPLVFFSNGNTRLKGLCEDGVVLSAEALHCLADYIYWGGLRGEYRALLEEEAEEGNEEDAARAAVGGGNDVRGTYRQGLRQTLEVVQRVAARFGLHPLEKLCCGLLQGSRADMQSGRVASADALRRDMSLLLDSGAGANVTMLVVDPHTKKQTTHALHAAVLMAASELFATLLRPLFAMGKISSQVHGIAAKVSGIQHPSQLLTSTSKRAVVLGPVTIPSLAVQPILRYLYAQHLHVPAEVSFETMLGAHALGLHKLKAFCESIVAREEVNYDSCCSYYYLSHKYEAALLGEIALLTAVSGFSTVRHTTPFKSLSPEDKQSIEDVAAELGTSSWAPPQQQAAPVMKPKSTYESRWSASNPL